MRIACVHVPQFSLQCATRIDPALRGEAVVVSAAGVLHGPIVQACSRAAWARGVRVGMTTTAARGLAPDLIVVPADPQLERDTVRALADVLLGLAPQVDAGGRVGGAHLAMYGEVPSKTRGTSFGERVVEQVAALGLTARVGIADDRFTAWVAASQVDDGEHGVVSVPRGGSAAFLAPKPLALLAIAPEVQRMLEALGVRTLGEFAALPAPSVGVRPLEADYQALARGESGQALRGYAPDAPIREELAGIGGGTHAPLAERVALRLAGRGRGAARLEVAIIGEDGERVVSVVPARRELFADATASAGAEVIAEAIDSALAGSRGAPRADGAQVAAPPRAARLRVVVTGEALLGEPLAPIPAPIPAALAVVRDDGLAHHAVLGLVLSNTGTGDLFGGPAPLLRAERRGAHRRTQRGKQRRGRIAREALVQPRLFK